MRTMVILVGSTLLFAAAGCADTRGRGDAGPRPVSDAGPRDAFVPPGRDGGGDPGGDLRIVGAGNRGRLEVFHEGAWGTICDDSFDEVDATVACRQLGFSGGTSYTSGDGADPIWMDDIACTGIEARLVDCSFSGWAVHDCSHSEDVGVECF